MLNITQPTLLLDEAIVKRNIKKMNGVAVSNKLIFRPHFKTHQSAHIGSWFQELGVKQCTVSSLSMAAYFANNGWTDITVAFPVNVLEHLLITEVAQHCQLNVLVESEAVVDKLAQLVTEEIGIFIKIDAGYRRTGIEVGNWEMVSKVIGSISKHSQLTFKGLLVHNGHTYKSRGSQQISRVHDSSMQHLLPLMQEVNATYPAAILSMGDTPTFSVVDSFAGFQEMRPGNFVFYDLMQWQIGSCALHDIAVCMVCPIVAKHESRNEIIIYGGSVHFSKDRIVVDGTEIFGLLVHLTDSGWEIPKYYFYLTSVSQEHGIIKVPNEFWGDFNEGDLIGILPIHACLAANLIKGYLTTKGERIGRL